MVCVFSAIFFLSLSLSLSIMRIHSQTIIHSHARLHTDFHNIDNQSNTHTYSYALHGRSPNTDWLTLLSFTPLSIYQSLYIHVSNLLKLSSKTAYNSRLCDCNEIPSCYPNEWNLSMKSILNILYNAEIWTREIRHALHWCRSTHFYPWVHS